MSERASIFDDTEFDISGFAPRQEGRGHAPGDRACRFGSGPIPQPRTGAADSARRKSTGAAEARAASLQNGSKHTAQCQKVRAETLDSFYALADEKGWVLGETLERALAALRKNLAAEDRAAERVKKGD